MEQCGSKSQLPKQVMSASKLTNSTHLSSSTFSAEPYCKPIK
jgi:hypothetical protein